MPVKSVKRKGRRYIRYAIQLEAVLVVDAVREFACVIHDFCIGGFFLALKEPKTRVSDRQPITVRFSASSGQNKESFEVKGVVAHCISAGIGVAVEGMPVAVFNALKSISENVSKFALPDKSKSPEDVHNQEKFKQAFKQMLIEKLPLLMDKFFESAGTELEKANDYSVFFTNRSLLDDFLTGLSESRQSFTSEFCAAVIEQIGNIDKASQQKAESFSTNFPLELIEKEEFEDWLKMSSLIKKLTERFEEPAYHLSKELGRVFGLPRSLVHNPISPALLCDSFREIVLLLEVNEKINFVLYTVFAKVLAADLGEVYDLAYRMLTEYESAQHRKMPEQYRQDKVPERRPSGKATQTEESQPPEAAERYAWPDADADGTAEQPAPLRESGIPSVKLLRVAGQLMDLLDQIDGESLEVVKENLAYGRSGLQSRTGDNYSSDELAAAISKLQLGAVTNQQLHDEPRVLQSLLQESLKRQSDRPKSLSGTDLHVLELYGKFFETLFSDLLFSPVMKAYLQNVHLPMLSLPIRGNDFLESESHPARNILNQLAALESAVKNNKKLKTVNIKSVIENLVTRISTESITNPEVFTEVGGELEHLVQEVAKTVDANIARLVEAYEGRQKLETARLYVQKEIDRRFAGKVVPAIIAHLLQSGWQQLLVINELNKEKSPDENQKYMQTIEDLIGWHYAEAPFLQIQAQTIQKTIDFVSLNMSFVCSNTLERNRIVEGLTASLLGIGEPKQRKPFETVKMPNMQQEPVAANLSEEDEARLADLRVGDWLMILRGIKGFEPMKLVWIGDMLPFYVFANRDGLDKMEFKKPELADYLRKGAANKMESLDVPLVDRVTGRMLQNMHEKLIQSATHDSDTNWFTRDEFIKQLKKELTAPADTGHILCHIEILDFRDLSIAYGSSCGSGLLKWLTGMLQERFFCSDELFARIGDASFAILFKRCTIESGLDTAKNLLKLLNESHYQWEEKSFSVNVSIGLAHCDNNSYDIPQLLQQANAASASAERAGPNRVVIFTQDDESLSKQKRLYEWIGDIDNVLATNRIFARCQKISPVVPGQHLQHYEILLGVLDAEGNTIPPDHFIPAVERCKRMPEIDQWMIKNVFDWIEQNLVGFEKTNGFSINLSGQSINSEEFLLFLEQFLSSRRVPLGKITFEITETVAAASLAFTKKFIRSIRQFGCKFSLDDFGSGYSSYSYLKNLNVDFLKIDGAFVKDIPNNKADIAIVKSMNEIAHSLGLKTIAEYVENDEIREILHDIGADYAQGYGIGKPIPLADLDLETSAGEEKFLFEMDEFWNI